MARPRQDREPAELWLHVRGDGSDQGADGLIEECAEAYINFLGGNRSFPIAAVMDDRRYRLKELEPGNVAMFDHLQHQLHFNDDGMFMTGRTDKKLKIQLGEPPQDDQAAGARRLPGSKPQPTIVRRPRAAATARRARRSATTRTASNISK